MATYLIDYENVNKDGLNGVSKLTEGKTLIVIAHRLSTITGADRIYVVNNGLIDDSGTHEELLSRHGLYEKMWNAHMEVKDNA